MQEQTLNKVLGCYRFVYNQTLALKQDAYNKDKTNLGLCELSKFFHGTLLKDEQYTWLKEQNTKVMKQAIRQMLSAYDGFQYENRIKPDYCNTGGLQVFDEDKQEWIDWSIDLGDSYYDSVDDYCESDDCDEKEELNAFLHLVLSNWKTRGQEK